MSQMEQVKEKKKKKITASHPECNRPVNYKSLKYESCYVGQSVIRLKPGTSATLNFKELLVLWMNTCH